MSPLAPTQLFALGSNLDSWYICAVIKRQSSPTSRTPYLVSPIPHLSISAILHPRIVVITLAFRYRWASRSDRRTLWSDRRAVGSRRSLCPEVSSASSFLRPASLDRSEYPWSRQNSPPVCP